MECKVIALETCEFETVLLAMAGHDLRQPLQMLQYVHDRFGNGARTRSELDMLRVGQSAIDRLREQLDQLLAALQLRERAGHIEASPVALEPLLREVYRESEWSALQKGIEIRLVPSAARIMSDPLLFRAVLRNLLNNAIKYTEPGGRILLGCRHFRDCIRIDVIDTGVGISEEQLPRIFEAFARFDASRNDGLGIGLFIVRQVVAMLGHRVDVCSVLSRGTRFSILAKLAHGSEPS